eukprot:g3601.t1
MSQSRSPDDRFATTHRSAAQFHPCVKIPFTSQGDGTKNLVKHGMPELDIKQAVAPTKPQDTSTVFVQHTSETLSPSASAALPEFEMFVNACLAGEMKNPGSQVPVPSFDQVSHIKNNWAVFMAAVQNPSPGLLKKERIVHTISILLQFMLQAMSVNMCPEDVDWKKELYDVCRKPFVRCDTRGAINYFDAFGNVTVMPLPGHPEYTTSMFPHLGFDHRFVYPKSQDHPHWGPARGLGSLSPIRPMGASSSSRVGVQPAGQANPAAVIAASANWMSSGCVNAHMDMSAGSNISSAASGVNVPPGASGSPSEVISELQDAQHDDVGGKKVLDLASGPGEPSLTLARLDQERRDQKQPSSATTSFLQIVTTDFQQGMVDKAKVRILETADNQLTAESKERLAFEQVSADNLSRFSDNEFDAVMMSFGLMFVPDRQKCLSEIHRVLKPGGRAYLSVWKELPFQTLARAALSEAAEAVAGKSAADVPPFGINPMALSAENAVESLARNAGLQIVGSESLAYTFSMGSLQETSDGLKILAGGILKKLEAGMMPMAGGEVVAKFDEVVEREVKARGWAALGQDGQVGIPGNTPQILTLQKKGGSRGQEDARVEVDDL